jgi:hypothetical protein
MGTIDNLLIKFSVSCGKLKINRGVLKSRIIYPLTGLSKNATRTRKTRTSFEGSILRAVSFRVGQYSYLCGKKTVIKLVSNSLCITQKEQLYTEQHKRASHYSNDVNSKIINLSYKSYSIKTWCLVKLSHISTPGAKLYTQLLAHFLQRTRR